MPMPMPEDGRETYMDGMAIMDVFKPQFQVQYKPRDMDSKASGVMGRQVKMNGTDR